MITLLLTFGMAGAATLEDAIRQAWKESPQLAGSHALTEAASADRWRRFLPHEPTFSYTKTDDGTAESFGLSLATSFPGKSFALYGLDREKAHAQAAEERARKIDLTRLLVQAFVDCAAAREGLRLQETTSNDLETLFRMLKALYETGHATQAEKIGAELQSRQAALDLLNATDKARVQCAKVKAYLPGEGDVALPEDLDPKFVSELGPETADQARTVAAYHVAEASLGTAYWSQMPDLTFSVTRNHYLYLPGSPSGTPNTQSVGVSLTFPILFLADEAQEAKRARGQARVDRDQAHLQKIAADSDQSEARAEYRRSRARLVELKAKDLPLGEALMESTQSAYRSGKLGYSELVLARKTLTDLRNQEIQLRVAIIGAHLRCLDTCDKETP